MVSSKSSDILQNVFVIGVLVIIVFVLYRCATMTCGCSNTTEHFAPGGVCLYGTNNQGKACTLNEDCGGWIGGTSPIGRCAAHTYRKTSPCATEGDCDNAYDCPCDGKNKCCVKQKIDTCVSLGECNSIDKCVHGNYTITAEDKTLYDIACKMGLVNDATRIAGVSFLNNITWIKNKNHPEFDGKNEKGTNPIMGEDMSVGDIIHIDCTPPELPKRKCNPPFNTTCGDKYEDRCHYDILPS